VAIIIAAGIAAYSNSFSGPYVFDDIPAIPKNPYIRRLWPITQAMKAPSQETIDGRPVLCLSLAVNYQISELEVWSYHAVNLIIHLGAGLVLFGIVRRTLLTHALKDRFGKASGVLALICAAIWVLHPLNTGSVTYIVQRAESLMGLFYLLTLYLAVRGFTSSGRKGWWYAGSVAACALGMGTKEVMFTAPLIAVIYDMVFVSRSFMAPLRRRWGFYLTLAATWGILLALVAQGPRVESVGLGFPDVTVKDYAVTQCNVLIHYFRLALFPDSLALDYDWPIARSFSECALEGVLGVAIWGGVVMLFMYRPRLGFLGVWVFLILGPTSSFLPIVTEVAAEHRMYLPLIGIVVLGVGGIYALGRYLVERNTAARSVAIGLGLVVAIGLAGLFGFMTYIRNNDYRSRIAIWADTVEGLPENSRARHNLGAVLSDEGKHLEAIEQFDKALDLKPGYISAINHRGTSYKELGRYPEALADFEMVISLDPADPDAYVGRGAAAEGMGWNDQGIADYSTAIKLDPDHPAAYHNRANAYCRKGNYDQAINDYAKAIELTSAIDSPAAARSHLARAAIYTERGSYDQAIIDFTKAIALAPGTAKSYAGRGSVYARQGYYDVAVQDFSKAIELDPNRPDVYLNRGISHRLMGNHDLAIGDYSEAIELVPNLVPAYNDRALAYHAKGNLTRAVQDLTKATELDPNYPDAWSNLGMMHGQMGDCDSAIKDYSKAIELSPNFVPGYYNRAVAYETTGRYDLAIADLTKLIELIPPQAQVYYRRAVVHRKRGDHKQGLADLDKAIELQPDQIALYMGKAEIFAEQREYAELIEHWRGALEIRKDWPVVLNALGWVLATHEDAKYRDPEEAVKLAERACELTGRSDPAALDTLAAAYAAAGQFGEAVTTIKKALELVAPGDSPAAHSQLQNRLKLYKAKRPYRERPGAKVKRN
jgi:tetratricopeptide (TPR) repeat protein